MVIANATVALINDFVSPQDNRDRRGAAEENRAPPPPPPPPGLFRVVDSGGILAFAAVFIAFNAAYWLDVWSEMQFEAN